MNDMTYLLAAGVSIPAIIGIIVLILIVLILVTSCFKIVFRKGRKDKRANLQTAKEGRRNTYCIPDSGT